ncbi:alpha/beta hydrolase-fold protein [Paenibacillus sp. UMB4589-SE434]|uniref:alpha/beta hydrolase n=1 Tax=Paenibacillus sp. UMB4589-SE434 TaxID=3046314 RepID=UPI00254A7602|nr:alpha/beta hydrolase-fold protein [Paenibacillus sp. UMB4589-SE434]MDK8183516.1 alpha/beta hydrolase-fold protein [Paenibacillus sp. UMB4589-SE434]
MPYETSIEGAQAVEGNKRVPVQIPGSEQWFVRSRAENRKYHIQVAVPAEGPPAAGYPVIYMLDGNSVFCTMVETARLQGRNPDKSGVIPAIVVGIGYETEGPFSPERYCDYTIAGTSPYNLKADGTKPYKEGGAAAFLQFIAEELMPDIQERYQVDASRQSIFGHSLGGLFVLYAMFAKPGLFENYLSVSPSVHWNEAEFLAHEQQFTADLAQSEHHIRLLIGAGENEKGHFTGHIEKVNAFAQRLSGLSYPHFQVEFKEFEGEGHISVLPVFINRSLRFALRPE